MRCAAALAAMLAALVPCAPALAQVAEDDSPGVAAVEVARATKGDRAEPRAPRAPRRKSPALALVWSLLPGGGQFYLGQTGAGIGYAVGTIGFSAAGAALDHRNKKIEDEHCGRLCDKRTDEFNTPSVVGEKIWTYAVFSAWRDAHAMNGDDLRALHIDDTPTYQLVTAPFQLAQLTNPWVLGALLVGGGAAAISGAHADKRQRDVSRVGMWGDDWNKNDGTAIYGVSSLSISLGAGVAEEAVFRGLLQPVLEDAWGTGPGLLATSGFFGAAHLVGQNGLQPGAVLSAAAGGLYFGYLYDHDDHRLAAPIAAHFWYDFMIFAVGFIVDPDNNPLGVRVKFNF